MGSDLSQWNASYNRDMSPKMRRAIQLLLDPKNLKFRSHPSVDGSPMCVYCGKTRDNFKVFDLKDHTEECPMITAHNAAKDFGHDFR